MAGTKGLLTLENFINGNFVPCDSYIDSYDPSTGEVYCRVPNSGKEEVSTFTKENANVLRGLMNSMSLTFLGAKGAGKRCPVVKH